MKRLLVIAALVAPGAGLLWFTLRPATDASYNLPLFHFYVVTFITFSAAVISILLSVALGPAAQPRHRLAATAFAVIGSIFFSHGLATPGALIDHFHPAVEWSAWLTLFGGGAIFAIAGLETARGMPRWLPVRQVIYAAAAGAVLYTAVAALAPQWLTFIDSNVAPLHKNSIFVITLALWLFAAMGLWRAWRRTRSRVDGALAFVACWLAQATVSMHLFTVWRFSWWIYHIALLVSFLVTAYILAAEYEQVRQFRLMPYFVAISLIATALLALAASALFTQFSYGTLTDEVERAVSNSADRLANDVSQELPDTAGPQDLEALAQDPAFGRTMGFRRMGLQITEMAIYDAQGIAIFASRPEDVGLPADDPAEFAATLAGAATAEVQPPPDPNSPGYSASLNHYSVEAYVPIYAAGTPSGPAIGVLSVWQDASSLDQVIQRARLTGLIIAALTMGLLLAALLIVVRRADRIITARTEELGHAYSDLRQAEGMRDDLTYMIVHDLRNPLAAILGSLDLLPTFGTAEQAALRLRMVDNARSAGQRMNGLIDDLLAVGKIEAGELKPNFLPTDVSALVAARLEAFGPQAAADKKTISIVCPPGLVAELDSSLISRVLDNLVSNAMKYTEPEEGVIAISATADDGRIAFSVRDNGEGIADEQKERIFQKFVQAPNANTTPARKGTGLGLAFCRLVVELHGGQIRVQDAPGGGSEFVFWIWRSRDGL